MEDTVMHTSPLKDLLKVGGNKAMEKRAGLTDLVLWKETPRRTKNVCKKKHFLPLQLINSGTRLGVNLR